MALICIANSCRFWWRLSAMSVSATGASRLRSFTWVGAQSTHPKSVSTRFFR